jgi:hypothetical protein
MNNSPKHPDAQRGFAAERYLYQHCCVGFLRLGCNKLGVVINPKWENGKICKSSSFYCFRFFILTMILFETNFIGDYILDASWYNAIHQYNISISYTQ